MIIPPAPQGLDHYRGKWRDVHSPRGALASHIRCVNLSSAQQARCAAALGVPGRVEPEPFGGVSLDHFPIDRQRLAVDVRSQRYETPLLFHEPRLTNERSVMRTRRWVWAWHGSCPQIRDRSTGRALSDSRRSRFVRRGGQRSLVREQRCVALLVGRRRAVEWGI